MPDIGLGEMIVIAVLALVVFGPDRLPKVAADAARTLRNLRDLATTARRDLADAAGLPDADGIGATLAELHPRKALETPQRPDGGPDLNIGDGGMRSVMPSVEADPDWT
jgi:sec-independent protein translocase protein TatB